MCGLNVPTHISGYKTIITKCDSEHSERPKWRFNSTAINVALLIWSEFIDS